MALVNEDILLKKVSENDLKAFSDLFNCYSSAVYQFIYKFVKSPELSDDLSQEVFIKVWENRKNLAEVKAFRSYLFTLAKNHTFNFLKKASREDAAKSEILRNYTYTSSPVEDALLNREYLKYLEGLLLSLTPQSREVFQLCRQQNMSYDEVARLLGISRNAVKKHMVRSMKTFRNTLEKDLGISFTVF
ncbi:MAG TPA: RNA polymerase sigma-70 factor, partial [Sphingobacteriaceae bacterium]